VVKVIAKHSERLGGIIALSLNSSLTTRLRHALVTLILIALTNLVRAAAPADAGLGDVDFRYSLPWWQTAVCLPDDPDKTVVGKEGQLLIDYGRGGPRNFGVWIEPEIVSGTRWVRQETVSPRTPIMQTWKNADGVEVLEETFVVTPQPGQTDPKPRLTRMDRVLRWRGFVKPARPCSSAFTGMEAAMAGETIQFQLALPPGIRSQEPLTVVFGLCEGVQKEPGKCPLVLKVEGGESKTVDPVKDFGYNQPGLYKLAARDANHDGIIEISVVTAEDAEEKRPVVNALWVFDGPLPSDETIIMGEAEELAVASFPTSAMPERQAVVLMTLKNTLATAATRQPALRIHSVAPVRYLPADARVQAGESTRVSVAGRMESCTAIASNNYLVRLPPVTLKPGETRQVVFTVDRNMHKPAAPFTVAQARRLRVTAQEWWEKKSNLPFDTIQVPDAGIQAMLESSVRNIWQAREIKKGRPAFHVGPTVYRGLWVVDGSFLLESAALLGRGQDARAGVEYLLSHQKPDGSFELIQRFWKENGIVLWAATRHATLTQDKEWLRAHWPDLQRVVKAIQNLRAEASKDPAALDYRLLPPGEVDGGISNPNPIKSEYSNVYWCLAGLKSAIAAAHWLGDEASAAAWQTEFDDFYATYRKAAARDTLKDPFGNAYVPTMMGNIDQHVPARGQWAFCHAVYPGQVFPKDDALLEGQLAMLRATKVQGMVYDTGWMKEGIWTYFASFYAHAQLWQGRGREAAQVLYDFARHASPTRVWREEQKPVGKGGEEVGDMPHNWASAEFIRLATHLLELDRGDELHLLEGFPHEWAGPGMVTRLNGVLTPFGPLDMTVQADKDGKTATLEVKPLAANCKAIVVHLPDGGTKQLSALQGGTVTFPVEKVRAPNYARPAEPAVKPAFLPLPLGAVEPAGWLRDWAQAAREGITGHLDEWHPTFADGWKGISIKAPGARPDGTGWPIEQSAYWLDGALRLGFVLHDEALIKKIRARLDPVVEGVNKADFGTSFIYWKTDIKPEGFNGWAHSHMGRALVSLYQGSGNQRVLNALVKVYADYPVNMGRLLLGDSTDVTGLCNLDPMLETYSYSGDRRILDRALQAIAQPAVDKELQAWREGRLSPGHMVIIYENLRLPAVVYPWSGDPNLLQATLGGFKWLDGQQMLPYGVASGEEYASGIGAFRKTETCDVTAMLLSASWMYRIQGEGDWGDRMERAFFNAAAAPVARDFLTMSYYQSPNRLRSDSLPCEQPHSPGPAGNRFSRLGCATLCCVGALNRILPQFIIHMWMATCDNGLAATLYGPCSVSALAGPGVPVKMVTTTDYPFGETIRLKVEPARAVAFPLYLRIPGWCKNARITVNGSRVRVKPDAKSFAKLARTWAKGDVVELLLPMEPQVIRGYETEFPSTYRKYFSFEPAEVFQPRRLPYASVLYGPLLFSLPIADVDPNTPVADAKWRYALDTNARRDGGIKMERKPMPAHWDWPLDAPVVLKVPARVFDWNPTDAQALPEQPVTGTASETIRLVPYGCTKFRISMFPVTPRAWSPDAPKRR